MASDQVDPWAALDDLALSARHDPGALRRLLVEIVDRDLAEIPVRAYFFDDALVDDAVQEALVAVARGIHGYRGEASFRTWLDRVARNAARQVRQRERRSPAPVAEPDDDGAGGPRMSSLIADERVVAAALGELGEEYRTVLLLREVEDLTYDQIAQRLGLPLNTVRTRLRRARLRLAEILLVGQEIG